MHSQRVVAMLEQCRGRQLYGGQLQHAHEGQA